MIYILQQVSVLFGTEFIGAFAAKESAEGARDLILKKSKVDHKDSPADSLKKKDFVVQRVPLN